MDPTWSLSYPELWDDDISMVVSPFQMNSSSIDEQPNNNSSTNLTFINPNEGKSPLASSPPPPMNSSQFISFGNSDSKAANSSHQFADNGFANHSAKVKEEINQMICFNSMDLSPNSNQLSSSDELQYYQIDQGEPVKKSVGRTPLQAKYHVIAERKRREKLSGRFRDLAAMLPGLEKLDKSSIIEGAINRLKELEKRLQDLGEMTKRMKDDEQEESALNPRVYYHYEEDYPLLRKMVIRISNFDVSIDVNCKSKTGLREEEFVCEMEKLDLNFTNRKFTTFGDNMLCVSAAAQMNERFCRREEKLAKSIRRAVLKMIVRIENTYGQHSDFW
ncbi:OLC1v1035841C1 [Oldenlandia corymbosa var. corymbosa]|uniref:OLC1v1035841C1 n=1 Tax=Oldenlandia corymbosa var. corymbosa TaxID=529605 RepID=A0AAV1CXB4_OLDCO|nr:OLC1v1035841C1 [Oldenlandia corymbosa var. corymbosa]